MKTVLITGANKGIGLEVARQLASYDYYVYLGSRSKEKGLQAISLLRDKGINNVELIEIDVSNPASVQNARQDLGGKISVLDALINNAGIRSAQPQPPTKEPVAVIKQVFETNFFGMINVTQTFFDLLQKAPLPRIVNVTSGLASLTLHADPSWKYYTFKNPSYGPSKTALNAYTLALAYELRDTHFKVNAVDPGYTKTDFNNHRGTGSIEQAAARIVKYVIIDESGPTGKYFSDDNNPLSGESPW